MSIRISLAPILLASLLIPAQPAGTAEPTHKVISINFTKEAKLEPEETAGVVEAGHWNDAPDRTGTIRGLLDNHGKATEAGVDWFAGLETWSNTEVTDESADGRLMKEYLDCSESAPTIISLTGLESAFGDKPYDIIIYTDGQNAGAARVTGFIIGDKTLFAEDPPRTSFSGWFEECAGAELESDAAPGNYVRFRNLTGDSTNIEVFAGFSQDPWPRGVICGLQIVSSGD